METRILIPKGLKITFVNSPSTTRVLKDNGENCSAKVKGDGSNFKIRGDTGKEKPTSSSGCDAEDSDSDSDFNATEAVDTSGEDTDCEGLKISKIWNPSYNLRRSRNQQGSGRENEKRVKEEKVLRSNSDFGIIVANADSNVPTDNSGHSEGKVGDFSKLQICAGRRIEKGSLLSPNEGEVSILFVQDVPPIDNNDIRFIFGCFDRIIYDDPKSEDGDNGGSGCDSPVFNQIRLCNWIRFLKHSPGHKEGHDSEVNCVGKFVDGQAIFEFTRKVLAGQEIIATFDIKSITRINIIPACPSVSRSISESVPLDLSKSPEAPSRANSRSPESVSDSNESSSPKTAPVNMFPFSISSVLQPSKIFQPYSQLLPSLQNRNAPSISASSSNMLSISNMTGNLRPMSSLNFQPTPSVRPILRTRGRERSLLPCEVCGKAFDRPSLLKRHMRTHTGEKPHICDVCSKGFSTSSSLNTHRRIHSGEKPHQCPICGKRFTASSNLYYHRMTHNKEKPHKCLLCGKSFPTPGDLKSHQYVHSGSWPYNCPVCHRGFSKQTNLRNHLLLHSGDKPHTCQVCGKKFALACNLRAHVRTHEEEPVSSCVSCKRTFLSSLNMLDNGQCRTCIIHQQQNSSSGGSSGGTTSNAAIFPPVNNPLNAGLNGTNGVDTKPSQSLALSVSKLSGVPATVPPITAPFSAASSAVLNESILAGFSHGLPSSTTGYIGDTMNLLRPNPFLEQLFQWNWRFAKETAGNLGLMQQKLLESQMLAAQLMSVSQNSGVGGADILKFRL